MGQGKGEGGGEGGSRSGARVADDSSVSSKCSRRGFWELDWGHRRAGVKEVSLMSLLR